MKTVKVSNLRRDIYRLMDEVLATGEALVVQRGKRTLRIVPEPPGQRLERLVPHDCIVGDPEDLVHVDWTAEWEPGDL